METLDLAMKIITGPWDLITWLIVIMFGASMIGLLYQVITGKSFDNGTSFDTSCEEDYFTDYNKRYIPWNIWNMWNER
ncbi:hypothetical protein [Sulfuricurvum sp.]|uniref:hypothetical protein n=1 Tax=Sulfuricurvum sp. TaxID=2025608 RepID=UPI00263A0939|nr:hypothetical protein [Sulfuricurvum sp.]MDD2781951.1 hypothetical protein [Sulfuricurvum sp.]